MAFDLTSREDVEAAAVRPRCAAAPSWDGPDGREGAMGALPETETK